MKRKPRKQKPARVMGFYSSRRRAVCRDCTCPQPLASADLGSRAAPRKTSKVNSRAINLPLASEGGQEVLHPALLAALPGRHLATAKRGTSSPQISPLLSWGSGRGKVPTALGLIPVSHDGGTRQKLTHFIFSSLTTHQLSHCNSVWF